MQKLLLVLALLLAAVPVNAQCVGTTCGSSLTTYLLMCRVNGSCNKTDLLDNLNNNWIKLDKKFAPSLVLEGHGHRGTNGDGPLLSAKASLDCSNNPTNGQSLTWQTSTDQCLWATVTGGGGSGNVTGPGTSVDRAIPTWSGTGGDTLRDASSAWSIDASNRLVTATGRIGINDITPETYLDVENTTPQALDAAQFVCSGAVTASAGCVTYANTATSSSNNVSKYAQVVTVSGANGGTNSNSVGTFYAVTGGTTNQALYVGDGDIYVATGRIGIGDFTPDARFESDATTAGLTAGLFTCATASPGSLTCTQIDSTATGGAGDIKVGLQVNATGTYDSDVYAIKATASGGTATNTAVEATAGNIIAVSGRMGVRDTSPDALIEGEADASIAVAAMQATCTGARTVGHSCDIIADSSTSSTAGINKNALIITSGGTWSGSGAQNSAIYVDASGGTTNYALYANAGDIAVPNGKVGVGTVASLGRIDSRTTDTSAALNTTCTGTATFPSTCNLMTNSVASSVPGVSNFGLFLTNDGVQAGSGSSNTVANVVVSGASPLNVGLAIDASGGTVNNAISVSNGHIIDIGGRLGLGDATPDYLMEVETATAAVIPFGVTATGTRATSAPAAVISNSATGGDGASLKTGLEVTSGGVYSGNNVGIAVNVSGASGANIALLAFNGGVEVLAGNMTLDNGKFEVFQPDSGNFAFQNTCPFVGGADPHCGVTQMIPDGTQSGIARAWEVEAHTGGGTGDAAGLYIDADGDSGSGTIRGLFITTHDGGTNLAISSTTTGAVTTASVAHVFSNTTTSSTAAINKVAVEAISTGTWNGAGAINAGVRSSATGGTLNYAFWALQGGYKGELYQHDPVDSPVTCAAEIEGTVYYDASMNLLCVCSDSDGGTFEWETVEDRTVTCT